MGEGGRGGEVRSLVDCYGGRPRWGVREMPSLECWKYELEEAVRCHKSFVEMRVGLRSVRKWVCLYQFKAGWPCRFDEILYRLSNAWVFGRYFPKD